MVLSLSVKVRVQIKDHLVPDTQGEMSLCLFLCVIPWKYWTFIAFLLIGWYLWEFFGHPVYFLWCFFLPAKQCPLIHVDNNVQVIGDLEEATSGNVVRFSCKSSSEILIGSSEVYCDDHGEWSSTPPKCQGTEGCPKWKQEVWAERILRERKGKIETNTYMHRTPQQPLLIIEQLLRNT